MDPIMDWMKTLNPSKLQNVIKWARVMQSLISKVRNNSRGIPLKDDKQDTRVPNPPKSTPLKLNFASRSIF